MGEVVGGRAWVVGYFIEEVLAPVSEAAGAGIAGDGPIVEVYRVAAWRGWYVDLSSGKRCDLPKEYLCLR